MISPNAHLQSAREALAHVENALAALRARVEPRNPALFAAMAEDYAKDIRRLRAEIDALVGLSIVEDASVPLWMVLEGDSISPVDISSRLLSAWLEKFRKALYGHSEYLETGRVKLSGGRPDAKLLMATDPYVAALAPGSIRIGLRLPNLVRQEDLFDSEPDRLPTPLLALRQLLQITEWAVNGPAEVPELAEMSRDDLSLAARFASRLAPTPRSDVRSVSFFGPIVPSERPLRLTAESRERLNGLKRLLSHVSEETIRGQIREIDLDARRIIIRERGDGLSDMKCTVPETLLPTAQGLLNHEVVVVGLVSSSSPDSIAARSIAPAAGF